MPVRSQGGHVVIVVLVGEERRSRRRCAAAYASGWMQSSPSGDDGCAGWCDAGAVTSSSASGRRDAIADVGLTLALGALSAALVLSLIDGAADRIVAGLLVAGHVAPLLVRRRHPVGVLAAMIATSLLSVPLGVPVVVLGPGVLVGLYTVGALVEPPASRWALGGALLAMAVVVPANGMDAGTLVTNAIGLSIAWWLGDRARRAVHTAERERADAAEAARRAAGVERLRIARELHDVVAHAMSVIAVQAGTGRFVIDQSPEVARDALAAIETTSRSALEEMRRLLSVLRDDDAVDDHLLPAPGLGDLDELVTATTQAGVAVDLTVQGEVVALPSGLDLCAYRVVQEALTNVRRHARATRAAVSVTYAPDCLHLVVDDDGVGLAPGPSSGGHGLVGMSERVGLYGGSLDAGPRPDGGYRVAAHLPLAGPR
jgi:signal transduction histidine kinase